MSQLSQAIDFAIQTSHPQCDLLPYILSDLTRMENHPRNLTENAYKWCSTICKNYQNLENGQQLLFLSMEVGFHHLGPQDPWNVNPLTHTEHHHKLGDIIFESGDDKAIADLLLAWTLGYHYFSSHGPLNAHAEHITLLHEIQPFSSRLRQVIIYSIEVMGYEGFKEVGVEALIPLLNSLDVALKDMACSWLWLDLLLVVIQFSEATQHLSHHYWELLLELTISWSSMQLPTYHPQVMISLKDAQEWDKLEYWIGVIWMVWPPEDDEPMEKELEDGMLLLFHQQPGAIQRLQQWMQQWSDKQGLVVPKSFEQICEKAYLGRVQQDTQ